jgi:GR25 family glycosyltransferase involved in LPS biosynthesis
MPAPIALFAYKRANELQRTIQALQANYLAAESELYVFVDGPKRKEDSPKVDEVRQLVQQIKGFRQIQLRISEQNIGCADSIINGVSKVLHQHPAVIVVEDDLVTTPNFLDFMNQGLLQYANHPKVFSLGGYTFPFKRPIGYTDDVYFYGRTCAWGWGIWADRWFKTDWKITDFKAFMTDKRQQRAFNYHGSDRVRMLNRTLKGEVDAWDIRLCYNQFKQNGITVYPAVSKIENIGFYSTDGMNTNVYNRYQTVLDHGTQRYFSMPTEAIEHQFYTQQFRNQFSIGLRLLNRLKTYTGMR